MTEKPQPTEKDSKSWFGTIIKECLSRLPAPLVLVVAIVAISLYFFLKADPPLIWPSVVVVILAVILAFIMYYLDQRRKNAEENKRTAERDRDKLRRLVETSLPGKGEQRDSWTRPMLQLPLKESVIENVFQVFDAILSETSKLLSDIYSEVDSTKVRANVFLPTSEKVREGDVCNLIIPGHDLVAPSGLQRNMNKGNERSIAFRPNQGATGRVFVEKRALGVLTHPSWLSEKDEIKRKEIERWVYVRLHPEADLSRPGDSLQTEEGKSQFEMTDFQNLQVAEKLAWIISMPIFIKTNETYEVVGVCNVDCLEYQLKPAQLRAFYYRIVSFAGVFSGVFSGLPTERVAIFRFRSNQS